MKKLLMGAIAILVWNTAHAGSYGLPEEDPVVAKLQAQFKSASLPTDEQLKIGKIFNCHGHISTKGDFDVRFTTEISFSKFNGFVVVTDGAENNKTDTTLTNLDGKSLVGNRLHNYRQIIAIRASGEEIFVEQIEPNPTDSKDYAHSMAIPNAAVFSYNVCLPKP